MEEPYQNQGSKWWIAYLLSIPVGAVALPAWCYYLIAMAPTEDQGSPQSWIFLAIIAGVVGAVSGPLIVAFLQFIVWVISWFRDRNRYKR